MAVIDFDSIDDIYHDDSGNCHLVIEDELDWSESYFHISALQNKLKTYLYYIESGQLEKNFQLQAEKYISIVVKGDYPVPKNYHNLLTAQITQSLSDDGISFTWEVDQED